MEALIGVVVIVLVIVGLAQMVRVTTVRDYERGLRYRQGRLTGLVDPGTHVTIRPLTELQLLDGRPTSITVPGQEILTADGVALRASLTARYVVADPIAATTNDQNYVSALYTALHAGLREALAGRTADEILASRGEIGPAVGGAVASEIARLGIELLGVDVRDLMVPSELKRAYAGIVAARREGEAAVERARGETAALRGLANAGRMLDDNPGLLQLRVLQELGASSGNTIMLALPGADGGAGTSLPTGGASVGPTAAAAARTRSTARRPATD